MTVRDFAGVGKVRKVALNLRDVPADLRNRFKSYCSRNELTMTGAIVTFMERTVERSEGKNLQEP